MAGNATIPHENFDSSKFTLFPWIKYVIGVLFVISCVVGVFGNLLVIVAVLVRKLKKTVTNVLVFNLALTDIGVSILPMPVYGIYYVFYWPEWTLGRDLCKASLYVMRVCGSMSVNTLVVIALDRYFAIVKKRKLAGKRKIYLILGILWIISALTMLYPLLGDGLETRILGGKSFQVCQKMDGERIEEDTFFYTLLFQTVMSVFIILCLGITYVSMIMTIWRSKDVNTPDTTVKGKRGNVRALKFMFIILMAFLVTWVPYFLVTLFRLFPPNPSYGVNPSIVLLLYTLAITNSAWNPVLYALLSKTFRMAYKDLLSLNFSKHSINEANDSKYSMRFRARTGTNRPSPLIPRAANGKTLTLTPSPALPRNTVGARAPSSSPNQNGFERRSSVTSENQMNTVV